jgi:hypothetical protein
MAARAYESFIVQVYFDTINFSAPLSTPLADKTLQKIILGAIDPGINQTSI